MHDGRYGDEIERVMRAASRLHHFRWERGAPHDGYADVIESMLCLLPFHPARWRGGMDRRRDFRPPRHATARRLRPRASLDGNLQDRDALCRVGRGARLEPWREDPDRRRPRRAGPWTSPVPGGRRPLVRPAALDGVRHRTSWNLRRDYPRRNGSPEWFTVESGRSYVVRDLDTGDGNRVRRGGAGRRVPFSLGARATAATFDRAEQRLACWDTHAAPVVSAPRTARDPVLGRSRPVALAAQVARSGYMLGDARMAIEPGERRGAHDACSPAGMDEDRLTDRRGEEAAASPRPGRGRARRSTDAAGSIFAARHALFHEARLAFGLGVGPRPLSSTSSAPAARELARTERDRRRGRGGARDRGDGSRSGSLRDVLLPRFRVAITLNPCSASRPRSLDGGEQREEIVAARPPASAATASTCNRLIGIDVRIAADRQAAAPARLRAARCDRAGRGRDRR